MRQRLRKPFLLGALLLFALAAAAPSCSDFERTAWVTIRDADAALESGTTTYEEWKAEEPQQFTDAELEKVRALLFTGNEALAAAEAGFTAYRSTKSLVAAGDRPQSDLQAAERDLRQLLNALQRAVVSVRQIVNEVSAQESTQSGGAYYLPVHHAQFALPMIAILVGLLGEFLQAGLGGKKGRISQGAVNLVAAVLETHQQATGEDIDLATPALRTRIAARRKRLAKAA